MNRFMKSMLLGLATAFSVTSFQINAADFNLTTYKAIPIGGPESSMTLRVAYPSFRSNVCGIRIVGVNNSEVSQGVDLSVIKKNLRVGLWHHYEGELPLSESHGIFAYNFPGRLLESGLYIIGVRIETANGAPLDSLVGEGNTLLIVTNTCK